MRFGFAPSRTARYTPIKVGIDRKKMQTLTRYQVKTIKLRNPHVALCCRAWKGRRKEGAMVSDNQIQVWQDGDEEHGYLMKIQSRYLDDPRFTLEQERAIHEIVRSFLLVNRQTARRKRYAEKRKQHEN